MGLFYSGGVGDVDGKVVFSRGVSFFDLHSTVTLYRVGWGSGCYVTVVDESLPGVEVFDVVRFVENYLHRVRDYVIRSSGYGSLSDAMLNAYGKFVTEYLRKVGVKDRVNVRAWASLLYRFLNYYGSLETLFAVGDDVRLSDVYVSPGSPVYVKTTLFGNCMTNIVPSDFEVNMFVQIIGDRVGVYPTYYMPSVETYDRAHKPLLRISMDSFDVSDRPRISIRVFPSRAWKLIDMVRLGTLNARLAAILWLALELGLPILVIGPTGAGKTSLSAALISALPPSVVVAKVEDIDEVLLPQEVVGKYSTGVIPLLSREAHAAGVKSIPLFSRLVHALRMGVDYIFINEVRTAEDTRTWFHAIMTGQAGGATSMHARGLDEALARLMNFGLSSDLLTFVVVEMIKEEGGGSVVRRVSRVWFLRNGERHLVWDGDFRDLEPLLNELSSRFNSPVIKELGERELFLDYYSRFDVDEEEWVRLVSLFYNSRAMVMPRVEENSDVIFDESGTR